MSKIFLVSPSFLVGPFSSPFLFLYCEVLEKLKDAYEFVRGVEKDVFAFKDLLFVSAALSVSQQKFNFM